MKNQSQLQKANKLLERFGDADMSAEEIIYLLKSNGVSLKIANHFAQGSWL